MSIYSFEKYGFGVGFYFFQGGFSSFSWGLFFDSFFGDTFVFFAVLETVCWVRVRGGNLFAVYMGLIFRFSDFGISGFGC